MSRGVYFNTDDLTAGTFMTKDGIKHRLIFESNRELENFIVSLKSDPHITLYVDKNDGYTAHLEGV